MFLIAPPALPDVMLTPAIDIRERYEHRNAKEFDKAIDDNRSDLYCRARFIVNFKYGDNVTGQLQYRYAHDYIFTEARSYSADRSDLDHAYIALKQGDGVTTLGRQEVVKGAGKLLGTAEFTQISTIYDGARFTNNKWDAFAGKLDLYSSYLSAAWLGMSSYRTGLGETMFIAKQDEAAVSDAEIYTIDHRNISSRGRLMTTIEGAYQFGRYENKDIDAFAGHARVDYKVLPQWTLFSEANVASGGSSATKYHNFNQLQAGNHWWYGQMDMQGWENMKHLEAGVNFAPDKRLAVGLQWHAFELYDAKSAWYGVSGAINEGPAGNFVDPTGASGKDLGQEIDLSGTYELTRDLQLQFGLATFQPGGFVRAFNGADTVNQYWGYFGVTAKF
jgi:hypothetical protein